MPPSCPMPGDGVGGNKRVVVGLQVLPSSSVSHSLGLERSFIAHFDLFFFFNNIFLNFPKRANCFRWEWINLTWTCGPGACHAHRLIVGAAKNQDNIQVYAKIGALWKKKKGAVGVGESTFVMAWVCKWLGNETPPCYFFILGWLSLASSPEKGSWTLLPQDEIGRFCISSPSSCILPPPHQALWMAESCDGQYRSSLTCHCWSCSLGWESGERGVPRSPLSSAPGERWGPPPGGRRSTCASFHTCQGALQKQRGARERGRGVSPEVIHELAMVCIPHPVCPPGGAE